VTSGSVLLQAAAGAKGSATLVAGDVALVQSTGEISTQHHASTPLYLGWMQDSLVFRDASLAQVSDELRRWYGVTLRVSDSALAQQHLTNIFYRDPIDRVLQVIGLSIGADVERRGDTAFVRPRHGRRGGGGSARTQ
jgi:transmembrane sensor